MTTNNRLNASEAVDTIKNVKVDIFGQLAQKYNYQLQIKDQLQAMAEKNEISPAEYLKSLKIVDETISLCECDKKHEAELCN